MSENLIISDLNNIEASFFFLQVNSLGLVCQLLNYWRLQLFLFLSSAIFITDSQCLIQDTSQAQPSVCIPYSLKMKKEAEGHSPFNDVSYTLICLIEVAHTISLIYPNGRNLITASSSKGVCNCSYYFREPCAIAICYYYRRKESQV